MLIDTHIIARQSASAGAVEVLAECQAVQFKDGAVVQLHPVQAHGHPLRTQRVLVAPGQRLCLFNLAVLLRGLDTELGHTPHRDVAGLVFYSLRQAYPTAALFVAAVERTAMGTWWAVGDGWVWHSAARQIDAQVLATSAAAVAPAPAARPPAAARPPTALPPAALPPAALPPAAPRRAAATWCPVC